MGAMCRRLYELTRDLLGLIALPGRLLKSVLNMESKAVFFSIGKLDRSFTDTRRLIGHYGGQTSNSCASGSLFPPKFKVSHIQIEIIIGSPAIPIFSDVAGSLDVVLCKALGRPIAGYADICTAHVSRKKGRSSLARLEAPMGSLSATLDAYRHLRTFFSDWRFVWVFRRTGSTLFRSDVARNVHIRSECSAIRMRRYLR